MVWLHGTLIEDHPKLTKMFALRGGPIQTVQFVGEVDIAVTGSLSSVTVQLASDVIDMATQSTDDVESSPHARDVVDVAGGVGVEVALPMQEGRSYTRDPNDARTVVVDPEARVMVTRTVGAMTLPGTKGVAHGGFASKRLYEALLDGASLVSPQYGSWDAPVCGVVLANVALRETQSPASERVAWRSPSLSEAEQAERDSKVDDVFSSFVKVTRNAMQLRSEKLLYTAFPELYKFYVEVPVVGVAPVDSLFYVSTGLTADQLDALMHRMLGIVLEQDEEELQQMAIDTATLPPIGTLSKWRPHAAKAVHLAIRFSTEYRADGIVRADENDRLTFSDRELFPSHASRNFFEQTEDCDGSTTMAMRIANQLGLAPFGDGRYDEKLGSYVSPDPAYDDSSHVWSRAVRNALAGTDHLLFGVVAARSAAGTQAASPFAATTVAGHAAPIFMPVTYLLDALEEGDRHEVESQDRSSISRARAEAVFSVGKMAAFSRGVSFDYDRMRERHLSGLRRSGIAPLSIDGTVTCKMDMDCTDRHDLASRHAQTMRELRAYSAIGPTIADRALDLTAMKGDGNHTFYVDLVGACVTGSLCTDAKLVELGAATHHVVFVGRGRREGTCGASAAEVHSSNFWLKRAAKLTSTDVRSIEALNRMVLETSMPPRSVEANRPANSQAWNCVRSVEMLDQLNELNELHSAGKDGPRADGEETTVEMYVTPRALWNNPHAVEHLANRLREVASACTVDVVDLTKVQEGAYAVAITASVAV